MPDVFTIWSRDIDAMSLFTHTFMCIKLAKTGIRYHRPVILGNIVMVEINPTCSETSFKIMLKKFSLNQIMKMWIIL